MKWTTFCNKGPLFPADFRNNICAISFPKLKGAFIEIVFLIAKSSKYNLALVFLVLVVLMGWYLFTQVLFCHAFVSSLAIFIVKFVHNI